MAETLHLGPVNAYWDADSVTPGPVQLVTEGGASLALEATTAELFKDETGITPVDDVFLGGKATVTLQIADHDVALLKTLFPNVTEIGTTSKRYEFRPATGLKLSTIAKSLQLKKIVDGDESTDPNDWFTLCKAYPTGSATLEYTKDKQAVYAVVFKGLVDSANNNRYAYFGDKAATS